MISGKPLLVVCGATGNQGGSIVSYFLSQSPCTFAIRGITRDPSSAKSKILTSKGVEMVAAHFGNPSSLDDAFSGATVIYGSTDFWVYFNNPANHKKAEATGQNIGILSKENDYQEYKNIIDAAAKVDTLERFIMSSMAHATELSGGKYAHVYHFDSKALAEKYGKAAHPKLWQKTTVFYAGFYLENLLGPLGPLMGPKLKKNNGSLILTLAEPIVSARFPMYSVVGDTGALVGALLRAAPGQKVIGVNEWLSLRDLTKILARVLVKDIDFVDKSPTVDFGHPERTRDHMEMVQFSAEFGYDGGKVDKSIVEPADLGVSISLVSVNEWCEKQNWAQILKTVE